MDISRILVKLGTGIVLDQNNRFAMDRVQGLINDIISFRKKGIEVSIVSSGAVGLGANLLGQKTQNIDLTTKQAFASVGQAQLIHCYQNLLDPFNTNASQILVTSNDLADRRSYLNLRDCISRSLELNLLPIINENDCISTNELKEFEKANFGDNDNLSALVAAKLNVDLLVILTDVDGLYDKNPKEHSDAKVISNIKTWDDFKKVIPGAKSSQGRGGVQSKIEAARIASLCGVYTVIANGHKEGILRDILEKENPPGTHIFPTSQLNAKKRWLGFTKGVSGEVVVNEGACQALEEKQASLLAIGVIKVNGQFNQKSVVRVVAPDGHEIGRGMTYFSSHELESLIGKTSNQVRELFPARPSDIIHRDEIIIFKEYKNEVH